MKVILLKSTQKELDRIDDKIALKVILKIYQLGDDPFPYGSQKLEGDKGYIIRIVNYRVLYKVVKEKLVIIIIKVGHRKDVYK